MDGECDEAIMDDDSLMRQLLKTITPVWCREVLRSQHRNYRFRRGVKELFRDPAAATAPHNRVLHDIIYGWGNDGWSGTADYLAACVEYALMTKGPILECGSGITTLALGIIGNRFGRQVWTLEHNQEWGSAIDRYLKKYELSSVNLCTRPLKDFGWGYWYDPPFESMPRFSLVVCDGPPGDTSGGRYGLLPVMKDKLEPGAVILLDDAVRQQERNIAAQWAAELKTDFQIVGREHPYIVMRVPTSP